MIKFLIDDIKKDIETIKDLARKIKSNESIFDENMFKRFTLRAFFRENYQLFLCCFLTLLVGIFMTAKHYEKKANEFILDNCDDTTTTYGSRGFEITVEDINLQNYTDDDPLEPFE